MNCEACNDEIHENIICILKTGDATYKICPNCIIGLINCSLTPKQFKNLLKNGHHAEEFYLHGDFYDGEGSCIQPKI